MHKALQRFLLSLAAIVLLFVTSLATPAEKRPTRPTTSQAPPSSPSPKVSFANGETLTYIVLFNELPAGDAEIRLNREQQDGRDIYRVTGRARTNEYLDYLYKLRGSAEGRFTANSLTPLFFHVGYADKGRPRELEVRYDAKTKTLQGNSKRKNKVAERSIPAANVYDPSTALYLFRSANLTSGKSFQVEVFTGKERYRIATQLVRREGVRLLSGTRSAIRLHLEVFSLDDDPQKNLLPDETTLWVAPDTTHTPLKLESYLPIGQVTIELRQ
jgi:hypothetical protein